MELVTADVEEIHQGGVMQALGLRKGEMINMEPDGHGRVRLEYTIPSRGLIGFQTEFLSLTSGTGLLAHNFDRFDGRAAMAVAVAGGARDTAAGAAPQRFDLVGGAHSCPLCAAMASRRRA